MEKKPYRLLNHTADLGIEVYGNNFFELLVNSGSALFDMITDLSLVRHSFEKKIIIQIADEEEMLREWLEGLLTYFNTDDILFSKFKVVQTHLGYLQGRAWGEIFESSRHVIFTEIKGITYHQFQVFETSEGWTSRIIFDV